MTPPFSLHLPAPPTSPFPTPHHSPTHFPHPQHIFPFIKIENEKNLDPSFLTVLNDDVHYNDKNEPKQPQVCVKTLELQLIQVSGFRQKHQNFRGLENEMLWMDSP